jgi:hypothetical protein
MIETGVFFVFILVWTGLVTHLTLDSLVFYRRHLAPLSKN